MFSLYVYRLYLVLLCESFLNLNLFVFIINTVDYLVLPAILYLTAASCRRYVLLQSQLSLEFVDRTDTVKLITWFALIFISKSVWTFKTEKRLNKLTCSC